MKVEILADEIKVSRSAQTLRIAILRGEEGEPEIIVPLDAIETWDPPGQGPEVTLEDIQNITAAIEAACDKAGLDVEFE